MVERDSKIIKRIEEERKGLLEALTANGEEAIHVRVKFENNDVYEYLAKLDKTENNSSQIMIPTKENYALSTAGY